MSDVRTELARVEVARDAANVLHDHLNDVVKLTQGEIGGSTDARRGWRKRMGLDHLGERSLTRAFGAAYGPEQLRRAGELADELSAAVADVTVSQEEVATLGVSGWAEVLGDPKSTTESPAVLELFRNLNRLIAILGESRTRLLLAQMREGDI